MRRERIRKGTGRGQCMLLALRWYRSKIDNIAHRPYGQCDR
jgi:hypothetical protein